MPSHRDTDYLSAKLPSDGFRDLDSSYGVCICVCFHNVSHVFHMAKQSFKRFTNMCLGGN